MNRNYSIAYLVASLLVLILPVIIGSPYSIYLTKPLIGLILLAAASKLIKAGSKKKILLSGVLFSLLGDVLLMFEGETLFLAGLGSFLAAQVLYAVLFWKMGSRPHGTTQTRLLSLGALVYLGLFIFYLEPLVGGFFVPVVLYAIAITTMMMFSIGLKGEIESTAANLIMLGAVFFVGSDSILAIARFANPFEASRLFVMGTYIISQYGIVFGVIRADRA